jgi:hypothetical protein
MTVPSHYRDFGFQVKGFRGFILVPIQQEKRTEADAKFF